MGGIGSQELLLIIFFALIVFGAKRIPEIMRGLGRGLSEFKRAARDIQDEIEREIARDDGITGRNVLPPLPDTPEITEAPPRDDIGSDLPADADSDGDAAADAERAEEEEGPARE